MKKKDMRKKMVFIDGENIGYSGITQLRFKHNDKIYVFCKSPKVIEHCTYKGYQIIDVYPNGSNQADFAMVGMLVQKIRKYHSNYCYGIYSRDKALVNGFIYQCRRGNVRCIDYIYGGSLYTGS